MMTHHINFTEHLVMGGFNYAFGISAVDLTGNGILDLVTADTIVGLYWFENDGQGNFTQHIIHERTDEWLERHAIADINGDGRPEIVIVDNLNGSVLYFAFAGDPRDRNNWRYEYIIEGGLPGAYDVAVADFNGDGVLDVATSSWRKGNRFDWFEQRDGQWIQHAIEEHMGETRTICAADIDGDGKIDLLGTAREGNQIVWYQNPGDPVNQPWAKHVIDTAPQPIHGHPVDMTGNGHLDVVMALGMLSPDHEHNTQGKTPHQIVWYENNGNPAAGDASRACSKGTTLWRKHIICAHFPHAFEAIAADLDNDGQIAVVATAWDKTGRVALFKHRGDPRGPWDMQILKDGWVNANQVIVADLNGNGRLDIVAAAERGSNEVRWWRNDGRTDANVPAHFSPDGIRAMIIRKYQETDREALKTITAICFEGVSIDHAIEQRYGLVDGKDWRERKVRHIDDDIAINADGIFVAAEHVEAEAGADVQVIGYITTRIDHDTQIGGIPNLGVLPDFRGHGIGRKLIATAVQYAKAAGMHYIRIETLAQNPIGQYLYPSCGFEEIARQVHYVMPLNEVNAEES